MQVDLTVAATSEAAQWEGWGTALKPGHEAIVVARKPLIGTVAENVLEHGTGALNIDACRIAHAGNADLQTALAKNPGRDDKVTSDTYGSDRPQQSVNPDGRWPANVLLSHLEDCEQVGVISVESNGHHPVARGKGGLSTDGHGGQDHLHERRSAGETVESWSCAPGCPIALLDAQSGMSTSSQGTKRGGGRMAESEWRMRDSQRAPGFGDTGGASRFFYCAKTSRAERNAGLEGFEEIEAGNFEDDSYEWKTDGRGNPRKAPIRKANHHPTVKPINLMRWLCRLVTPPGGVILDPFGGSGTTKIAAELEGFECIVIEREAEYCRIAEARCRFWARHLGRDVKQVLDRRASATTKQRRRPRQSRDEDGS